MSTLTTLARDVTYPIGLPHDYPTIPSTIAETTPCDYRLASRNGKLLLQGCFKSWSSSGGVSFEWRDLPTVELSNATQSR